MDFLFHTFALPVRNCSAQSKAILLVGMLLGILSACSGPSKRPESGQKAPSTASELGADTVFPTMEKIDSKPVDPSFTATPSPTPLQKNRRDSEQKVAAKVNGEAIYEKDLDAGMPDDLYQEALISAKAEKLDLLISLAVMSQFLKKEGIEVREEDIDSDIARQRANPPSAGCPCCRYESLDQYMQMNHITMSDLRGMSRSDLGFQKYLEALWTETYPTQLDVTRLLDSRRVDFAARNAKAYHIFLNTAQDPRTAITPEVVKKEKMDLAKKAWERLQKGEAFGDVAKNMSEDAISAPNGGELGCVQKDVFGKEFDQALFSLKSGDYGKPTESQWGVHIIKRGEILDQDILSALKSEFKDAKTAESIQQIHKQAKIERYGEWAKSTP